MEHISEEELATYTIKAWFCILIKTSESVIYYIDIVCNNIVEHNMDFQKDSCIY